MERFRKFLRLPPEERRLVATAASLMAALRLGLWLLPLSWLIVLTRWNGRRRRRPSRGDPGRISWAVLVVSRYIPGATCLVQALTAQTLMASAGFPATLHIGVAKGMGERFEAHAWVECRGTVVVGGSGIARYTPLLSVEQGR
jgi:hypothetical protein